MSHLARRMTYIYNGWYEAYVHELNVIRNREHMNITETNDYKLNSIITKKGPLGYLS